MWSVQQLIKSYLETCGLKCLQGRNKFIKTKKLQIYACANVYSKQTARTYFYGARGI
jgi:hypothetical protein